MGEIMKPLSVHLSTRPALCRVCGNYHQSNAWPVDCSEHHALSALADAHKPVRSNGLSAPNVSTDTIKPVQSMLDGKMYDSKSSLRSTYKQAGVTEMGNDKPSPFKKPTPDKQAIKSSVNRAFSQAGLGA